MYVQRCQISCGIRCVFNLHGSSGASFEPILQPEEFLDAFWINSKDPSWERRFKFAIWSHFHTHFTAVQKIADYIEENNLGKVMCSEEEVNPNSGNRIKMWTWNINWATLGAWVEARAAKPAPKAFAWIRSS